MRKVKIEQKRKNINFKKSNIRIHLNWKFPQKMFPKITKICLTINFPIIVDIYNFKKLLL